MAQATMGAQLPTPADLARVLRAGVRNAESLRVTAPIREAVAARVRALSGGWAVVADGSPPRLQGTSVQFLDRVYVGRTEGLFPAMRINQWVIWWGIYSWGSEENADRVRKGVREIGLVGPGWCVERGTGGPDMPAAVWRTGGFVRVFKRLTAQQVEQLDTLEDLVSEIASDLWWWHERLRQVKLLAQLVE